MAVSKRVKDLYTGFFDGIETFAANRISDIQEERYLRKYIDKDAKLNPQQIKEIKDFWAPYCKVSPKWALYYSSKNGKFDPRYIPNTLYYTKIDQHFNARKLGYGFNDKNYYSKIFSCVKQPKTIVRNIGGLFFDDQYHQISIKEAYNLIISEPEVIVKPSQESGSGRGIQFFKQEDKTSIKRLLKNRNEKDYIVQAIVKQHPALENVHNGSLNTIRICTLLLEDGVHVLSSVLRMGVGKSKVDNATAGDNYLYDGMTCGINHDGTLKKYAHGYYTGNAFVEHPDGLVFEGYRVPSYEKAVTLVKGIHPIIGHFRLVSWDIAIDEYEQPLLIEANMRKGSINFHQFNNGPLFGDLTDRVLKEVFKK